MARGEEAASRMKRKDYEKELRKLQVKLCHLQEWVKEKKLRVIILFENFGVVATTDRLNTCR